MLCSCMANGNLGRAFLFLLLGVGLLSLWGSAPVAISYGNGGLDVSLVDAVTSVGRVPAVPADIDLLLSASVVEERAGN